MICVKCGTDKDISEFRINGNKFNPNYVRKDCKECEKKYQKQYRPKWDKTERGKLRAQRKSKKVRYILPNSRIRADLKARGFIGEITQDIIDIQKYNLLLKRELR